MPLLLLFILSFLCCINPSFSGPQFLILSDIHYGDYNEAKDGEDTGPAFFKIALAKMEQLSKQVDFILNLGDLPTHMLFFTSKKSAYEQTVFHALYEADSAKKPMFYIPGNNDSLSGNYQAFEINGESPLTYAKDWDGACVYCSELIIDKTPMYQGGYYSSYVMANNKEIILIALNSVLFVNSAHEEEAQAELVWLEQQLSKHSAKQLLIAMHIPPGANYKKQAFWQTTILKRFIEILERYSSAYGEITLLSGHSHMDELRKLKLKNGLSLYGYSTPGISRNHYNNPGMKLISLNNKMAVSNYTTYYTTSFTSWDKEQYQALGGAVAIFPNCHTDSLKTCLNNLSAKDVCNALENGLFLGVKSDRVPPNVCQYTYLIQ